jgi:hypothetical protein
MKPHLLAIRIGQDANVCTDSSTYASPESLKTILNRYSDKARFMELWARLVASAISHPLFESGAPTGFPEFGPAKLSPPVQLAFFPLERSATHPIFLTIDQLAMPAKILRVAASLFKPDGTESCLRASASVPSDH